MEIFCKKNKKLEKLQMYSQNYLRIGFYFDIYRDIYLNVVEIIGIIFHIYFLFIKFIIINIYNRNLKYFKV